METRDLGTNFSNTPALKRRTDSVGLSAQGSFQADRALNHSHFLFRPPSETASARFFS
jgi:hypothetical protein